MDLGKRFDRLTEVALDASSIIYMLKAGFLGLLGHTIRLVTIEAIREETGWTHPQLVVRPEPSGDRTDRGSAGGADWDAALGGDRERFVASNDERLLRFASASGLPVVSDDRELLQAAARRGMDHYNSLMMLLFLRYRERIDEEWYEEAYGHLMREGRYSSEVLSRFRSFCEELRVSAPPGARSEPPT